MGCREWILGTMGSNGSWGMVAGSRIRKSIVSGLFLATVFALAGTATAQSLPVATLGSLETSGTNDANYVLNNLTITAILSQPGPVNGIGGTGSSVVYTNAIYVTDGTGGMDLYGNFPASSKFTPAVGMTISVTGEYAPYHEIPELENMTGIAVTGNSAYSPYTPSSSFTLANTAAGFTSPAFTLTSTAAGANWALAQPVTVAGLTNDINNNSITVSGGSGGTSTVLPNDLCGYLVTLDNVKIVGAGPAGATFGTANSPSPGSYVVDPVTGAQMVFYYWPTSYSVANANIANMKIPTGLVNVTGFVSAYGNGPAPTSPSSIRSRSRRRWVRRHFGSRLRAAAPGMARRSLGRQAPASKSALRATSAAAMRFSTTRAWSTAAR